MLGCELVAFDACSKAATLIFRGPCTVGSKDMVRVGLSNHFICVMWYAFKHLCGPFGIAWFCVAPMKVAGSPYKARTTLSLMMPGQESIN